MGSNPLYHPAKALSILFTFLHALYLSSIVFCCLAFSRSSPSCFSQKVNSREGDNQAGNQRRTNQSSNFSKNSWISPMIQCFFHRVCLAHTFITVCLSHTLHEPKGVSWQGVYIFLRHSHNSSSCLVTTCLGLGDEHLSIVAVLIYSYTFWHMGNFYIPKAAHVIEMFLDSFLPLL